MATKPRGTPTYKMLKSDDKNAGRIWFYLTVAFLEEREKNGLTEHIKRPELFEDLAQCFGLGHRKQLIDMLRLGTRAFYNYGVFDVIGKGSAYAIKLIPGYEEGIGYVEDVSEADVRKYCKQLAGTMFKAQRQDITFLQNMANRSKKQFVEPRDKASVAACLPWLMKLFGIALMRQSRSRLVVPGYPADGLNNGFRSAAAAAVKP